MATVCLPEQQRNKLKNALISGKLSIEDLYALTSNERRAAFEKVVGKNYSKWLNSRFEQAMLSTQKKALSKWIKNSVSHKDPVRRDLLKKVNRIEKFLTSDEQTGFLEDIAETKLGIRVTEGEAKAILDLKKVSDDLRLAIPESSPRGSKERLAYGFAVRKFKQYVGDLKVGADAITATERLKPENLGRNLYDAASITKSLVATLDNSFIGRQGIKVLLAGEYRIWSVTAKESFKNFGKELMQRSPGMFKARNDAVLDAIYADIYSRPNALNGSYRAARNGYGLGVPHEEVFPTSLPERIPFIGRVFKASETAFTGSALRMRADLADAYIAMGTQNGLDMLDEATASSFGRVVTAMTGRGELGRLGSIGKELNVAVFSVRFLKSNLDTLTAHYFDKTMTKEAKMLAAKNLLKIATSLGAALTVAEMLNPGSVTFDPRKGSFGKIQIGETKIDITGGMAGIVRLAARLISGKNYSENTRKWSDLYEGGFGQQNALDLVENFLEGKASPTLGAVFDFMEGRNFQGDKPNFYNTTLGLIVPISAQLLIENIQNGNDELLTVMIAESVGLSPSGTTMQGFSKDWKTLKQKVDSKTYNDALITVTERFNARADRLEKTSAWKTMTQDERNKELDAIRNEETNIIMARYGI